MSGPRRILVAVDASPLSLDALDTAARMARRQGAELAVLHVEDINLSRLSNHPHVMAVSLVSARRLHPGEMLIEGALA
ncbi:MAG: universal stress protein, partial [Alphaproteobacteria bacterium]|nr:universal stress protein [Alphaproteobacteria bacterium]